MSFVEPELLVKLGLFVTPATCKSDKEIKSFVVNPVPPVNGIVIVEVFGTFNQVNVIKF